jgi:tetratricopeptide (TPR) repeat protein
MKRLSVTLSVALALSVPAISQTEHHHHPAPEHLGTVHFETSCAPALQPAFDRATALLHSFAYDDADKGFADVAARDPTCAMAHWGRAMTHYHQLWEVPAGANLAAGIAEIEKAESMATGTAREHALIGALTVYYAGAGNVPAAVRAARYSDAMAAVARDYPKDDEIATFYALSLIATAPPGDRTHERQKRAADILEPIWKRQPDHPGVPHYLIHAYDSAELAQRGLPAARAYAKIAPSAPHALHMPSHIFTRLGLWDDSIASNIAARDAASAQDDVGEQLHAMDYLTYAYLQQGRTADAAREVAKLKAMTGLSGTSFKIGYAANAMPVRLAVETRDWAAAAQLTPIPGSAPQVAAIVWWARALGKLRAKSPTSADVEISALQNCREVLRAAGDGYWATQTDALLKSAQGWRSAAAGDAEEAIMSITAAADEEDSLEKLPLTPGPIVPAREQLGELYLAEGKPRDALSAFGAALILAPNRLGALRGKAEAAGKLGTRQVRIIHLHGNETCPSGKNEILVCSRDEDGEHRYARMQPRSQESVSTDPKPSDLE